MSRPRHRAVRFRRHGQRHLPPRPRHGSAPSPDPECSAEGGEGVQVAADARTALATRRPRTHRQGIPRRGLPLAVVRLPVAGGRTPGRRGHGRSSPSEDRVGPIRRRPAADRTCEWTPPRGAQLLPGVPLALRDGRTRAAIAALDDSIDHGTASAMQPWEHRSGTSQWCGSTEISRLRTC